MDLLFLVLLGLAVCVVCEKFVTADKADVYVLAYLWDAEDCYENPTWYGCADPKDYWKKYFTIHGLWPQFSGGGYPSYCTDEAFNPASPEAVGLDDMYERWPNMQAEEGSSDYDSFWEHEWTKHGTCSPLAQTTFFNTTMNLDASYGTPSLVTSNIGGSVSASDLRNAMGGADNMALLCENGKYLSGAYSCWSMDSNGYPDSLTTCPSDVQGEDTCTSSTVQIPEF